MRKEGGIEKDGGTQGRNENKANRESRGEKK